MEKNLDANEFSTSIEELLKEDNDYNKKNDYESESDIDNDTTVVKKKETKTILKDDEPCFVQN